jgi:small redox-active disulfide protein 2
VEIKVLGMGCSNCKKLFESATAAVAKTGVVAKVSKGESPQEIMAYGVMRTPALVIDGQVKSAGKIPSLAQISAWITSAAGA